jgi:hypothetical protein
LQTLLEGDHQLLSLQLLDCNEERQTALELALDLGEVACAQMLQEHLASTLLPQEAEEEAVS